MYISVMNIEIFQHLKQAREKAGFTQKEVEHELGMRSLMMRDYETGRLKLPVTVALQIATLYKVSLDELVGLKEPVGASKKFKVISSFNSLFLGDGFNVMFLDPILRAFLEDYHDQYFENSLFDLLTESFGEKEKREVVSQIGQFLFSLAGADEKVSDEEIDCIRFLTSAFNIQGRYQELSEWADKKYLPVSLPKGLERVEMRHFVIWILFFFASADQNISIEEVKYIEKVAESLRVNRSNFLFIQQKFVKEDV